MFYGATWRCERCDLRWDTTQIPRRDYELIRRTQFRFRLLPITLGLATATLALFFTLTHNIFAVFALVPMMLVVWLLWIRPVHRRRYRAALANLPRWRLQPVAEASDAHPASRREGDS